MSPRGMGGPAPEEVGSGVVKGMEVESPEGEEGGKKEARERDERKIEDMAQKIVKWAFNTSPRGFERSLREDDVKGLISIIENPPSYGLKIEGRPDRPRKLEESLTNTLAALTPEQQQQLMRRTKEAWRRTEEEANSREY